MFMSVWCDGNTLRIWHSGKKPQVVGVGGFARYAIPANRDFSLAGYAYYGPSVLAFEDTKNLINTDFRFQYSPIPTARIYIGYRYVSFKQEGYRKRYELADGGHGGISIDF